MAPNRKRQRENRKGNRKAKTQKRVDELTTQLGKAQSQLGKCRVTFRADDGVDVELDRKGQPPPATPATGRGYRHQTEDTKDLVQWCVHFKGPGHNLGCLVA
ncbi:Hypp6738 [Branchiostoma lanceolatum]|uniref:Hypp6738 protein n=1 Tax=Branchiostoma lanceolatum TaxID=7740 RepID=A0A8J9YVF0_BRALA|nr:Hypp6738 [Branchiostoma lanceolatum]